MAIEKMYGEYVCVCDICGAESANSDNFEDCYAKAKMEGYTMRKVNGVSEAYCRECY